jgi:hypothetical protein
MVVPVVTSRRRSRCGHDLARRDLPPRHHSSLLHGPGRVGLRGARPGYQRLARDRGPRRVCGAVARVDRGSGADGAHESAAYLDVRCATDRGDSEQSGDST